MFGDVSLNCDDDIYLVPLRLALAAIGFHTVTPSPKCHCMSDMGIFERFVTINACLRPSELPDIILAR